MYRNCKFIGSLSLLIMMVFAAPITAQTPASGQEVIGRLQAMIDSEQFVEAYSLAVENLGALEGTGQFDLLYGIAAIENGLANEAVYPLQGVLATGTNEQKIRARLELARAYFLTNNMTEAETLFNEALQGNPPPAVQQNILAYLVLIDAAQRTGASSHEWWISSFAGNDGNVNSSTSQNLIDTPIVGNVELNPLAKQTEDGFSDLSGGGIYTRFLTRDRSITLDYSVNAHNNFSTDLFDYNTVRGSLALQDGRDSNRYRYALSAQKVFLDGISFQDSLGLSANWQHASENGWFQSATASFTAIRYDNEVGAGNNLRDVNQKLVSLSLTKLSAKFTNSSDLYYVDEIGVRNGGRHNGRIFWGAANTTLYRITSTHTPYARVSFQEFEYDDTHPVFFQDIRDDSGLGGALGWLWQYNRQMLFSAELSYSDMRSNIPLYDYSRFKAQLGFRYQFLTGR